MDRLCSELILCILETALPSLDLANPRPPRRSDLRAARRFSLVCQRWRALLTPLMKANAAVALEDVRPVDKTVAKKDKVKALSLKGTGKPSDWVHRHCATLDALDLLRRYPSLVALRLDNFFLAFGSVSCCSATLKVLHLVSTTLPFSTLPVLPHLVELSVDQEDASWVGYWLFPSKLPSLLVLAIYHWADRPFPRLQERLPSLVAFSSTFSTVEAAGLFSPNSSLPPFLLLSLTSTDLLSLSRRRLSGPSTSSPFFPEPPLPPLLPLPSSVKRVSFRLTGDITPMRGGGRFDSHEWLEVVDRLVRLGRERGDGEEAIKLDLVYYRPGSLSDGGVARAVREMVEKAGVRFEVEEEEDEGEGEVLPRSFVVVVSSYQIFLFSIIGIMLVEYYVISKGFFDIEQLTFYSPCYIFTTTFSAAFVYWVSNKIWPQPNLQELWSELKGNWEPTEEQMGHSSTAAIGGLEVPSLEKEASFEKEDEARAEVRDAQAHELRA
ncbi:hypothetical protein JCM8547_008888 [Rhodosporidiobolus lusitaniae]